MNQKLTEDLKLSRKLYDGIKLLREFCEGQNGCENCPYYLEETQYMTNEEFWDNICPIGELVNL
jgi:hypothetical protein